MEFFHTSENGSGETPLRKMSTFVLGVAQSINNATKNIDLNPHEGELRSWGAKLIRGESPPNYVPDFTNIPPGPQEK